MASPVAALDAQDEGVDTLLLLSALALLEELAQVGLHALTLALANSEDGVRAGDAKVLEQRGEFGLRHQEPVAHEMPNVVLDEQLLPEIVSKLEARHDVTPEGAAAAAAAVRSCGSPTRATAHNEIAIAFAASFSGSRSTHAARHDRRPTGTWAA